MDSILDEADKSTGETLDLLSLESSDVNDIVGEPLVAPRIGNYYQAQIPPLLTVSERLNLFKNPADARVTIDVSHSFLMGLPVPITWISQAKTIKGEPIGCIDTPTVVSCSNGSVNDVNDAKSLSSLKEDQDFKDDASNHLSRNCGSFPVPGLPVECWSEFEADCFLLGLYIFGKNLLQVGRFMGSKHMGKILSFYYGRFYGSPNYCRWSDCRKIKNKKCVVGQKLFSGGRQHELISRLLLRLSEELKNTLREVAKAYAEGRTSLEEYVSTLKSMVGLHALVEAVGIGKGKDDLTTIAVDTSKNANSFTSRPEIPSGNACSSLTCAEIIKFLTGGFRLSKARSNDIFWEAVWPRLLAKGWHSEQPKNDGYKGAKNCLVFLVPCVKRFSRRKLVKGDDYFDSVSDVLSKVASEPELLDLETGDTQDRTSNAENGWAVESSSDSDDDDDVSEHESQRYLKPLHAPRTAKLVKFTIVDTSLADGEKPAKIREIRSLPFQAKSSPAHKNHYRESDMVVSRESDMEPVSSDVPVNSLTSFIDASDSIDLANRNHGSQNVVSNSPTHLNGSLESLGGHNSSLSHKQHSRTIKHQFSRRPKVDHPSLSLPSLKRQKLLPCTVESTTPLTREESYCALGAPAQEREAASVASSMAEKSEMNSLAASNSREKSQEGADLINFQEHDNKPEAAPLVKGKQETMVQIKVEAEGEYCSQNPPVSCESVGVAEQNTLVSGRRQSTRVRPPTTRALEALEIGLLSPKQSRKRQWPCSLGDKKPRVSGRSRVRKTASASSSIDEDTNSEGRGYGKVSDSIEQNLSQRSSPPIVPHARNPVSANSSISSGTEPDSSWCNKVCYDTAQMVKQKSNPHGIRARKKESVNCSLVGEATKAGGSRANDRVCNSISETYKHKSRPSCEALVSNPETTNCFLGGSTEHRENQYARVCNNNPQTPDRKSRPSSHSLVRNSEAVNCDGAEGAESSGNGCAMGSQNLVHTFDPKSQSHGVPHVRDTYTAKGSVREDTKSGDNGYARVWQSIVETLNQKPRPLNQLHPRNIGSVTCSAGEGAVSGGSISFRISNGMVQSLSQKSFPPVRPDVRNAMSANCTVSEGITSGGSGSNKVTLNRSEALDLKLIPAGRPQAGNSESAKCSSGQSEGSGNDDISYSMGGKPKEKSRPSGRTRIKKKEVEDHGVIEGTESSGVSNSMAQALNNPLFRMAQALNNPLFQANQQVARELFGFSRPSKYPKP